jgi:hypothetical protein
MRCRELEAHLCCVDVLLMLMERKLEIGKAGYSFFLSYRSTGALVIDSEIQPSEASALPKYESSSDIYYNHSTYILGLKKNGKDASYRHSDQACSSSS